MTRDCDQGLAVFAALFGKGVLTNGGGQSEGKANRSWFNDATTTRAPNGRSPLLRKPGRPIILISRTHNGHVSFKYDCPRQNCWKGTARSPLRQLTAGHRYRPCAYPGQHHYLGLIICWGSQQCIPSCAASSVPFGNPESNTQSLCTSHNG